jgi:hypothetical protein
VSNNNDLDPAGSTQMFRAFVEGGTPNAPTPVEPQKVRSTGLAKILGPVLLVAVIVVLAAIVLH